MNKITLSILFFLSGVAGLMYEVVWIRQMVTTFGATTYAMSTVVTAFMSGLALGSWTFGNWVDKRKKPLLIYALLEAGIALSALLLPILLRFSDSLYIAYYQQFPDSHYLSILVRFVLSFIPLLIPTTLMGATLPVMSKHLIRQKDKIGSDIGILYSLNIVGAVLGAYLAGFYFIGEHGLNFTITMAVSINLFVAIVSAVISTKEGVLKYIDNQPYLQPKQSGLTPPISSSLLLLMFFFTGFSSLAFQILWTKALALYVDNTVYSYTAILTTFLIGLGLGGGLWSKFGHRIKNHVFILACVQFGIGVYGVLTIPLFHTLMKIGFIDKLFLKGDGFFAFSIPYFGITFPIMFIPTFLMGMAFPMIIGIIVQKLEYLGHQLGKAYSINTIGSIVGSFVGGFVLLPLIGIQKSIVVVSFINILVAAILLNYIPKSQSKTRAGFWVVMLAFSVFAVRQALAERPLILSTSTFLEKNYSADDLLFYKEDVTAVVTVRKIRTGEMLLEINGKSVAGTSYEYENTQKMQGHLPILLFGKPKSILQVGFGSGGSLYSISRHPEIEEIHCVEICKTVMEASNYFLEQNHNILKEPRLKIIHDDAVNYIRKTDRKYDLIMSDSVHPTYAGNGALYSVDYFENCKKRLTPGGKMSFWFPLYSLSQDDYKMIARSFIKVFPHTSLWYVNTNVNPYTIIVGSDEPFQIDLDRFTNDFNAPAVKEEMKIIGIDGPLEFLSCFIMAESDLAAFVGEKGGLNTDNNPIIEYSTPHIRKIGREGSWLLNFQDIIMARKPIMPFISQDHISQIQRSVIREKLDKLYLAIGDLLQGQLAQLNKRLDLAQERYRLALNHYPTHSGIRNLLEYTYREQGEWFRKKKQYPEAILAYQEAIRINPKSPKSNNNLATLYMQSQQPILAEKYLNIAIQNDPNYITPLLNLGFLYRDMGRQKDSETQFLKVLEIDKDNKHAWLALGKNGIPVH